MLTLQSGKQDACPPFDPPHAIKNIRTACFTIKNIYRAIRKAAGFIKTISRSIRNISFP